MSGMKLSVIVPAVNEERVIERTLKRVQAGKPHEVIVASCSTDGTERLARKFGMVVRGSRPWRSVLMNEGAKQASGDTLLFLHPDTVLPDNWQSLIPDAKAAAFSLAFDRQHWVLAVTAWWANNVRLRKGMVFGDHGLVVRKSLFDELGGFAPVGIFEDVEFSERLRKRAKVERIPGRAVTSARRYARKGFARQALTNAYVKILYALGASHERIRGVYRK